MKTIILFIFFPLLSFSQNIIQEKDLLGEDLSFENSYYSEGIRQYAFGNFQEAILQFNKALNLSPEQESIYANRADAKFALNDFRGAILDYGKSIELNPTNYSYNNRGLAKFKLEDFRGAINDYNLALIEVEKEINKPRTDPEFTNDYDKEQKAKIQSNRGNAKFMLHDFIGAISDYDLALEHYDIDLTYFNRGIAKIKLGQKDTGCLDLSKSGELGLAQAYDIIKKYCN
ncbi:hypothetical protein WFZ85_14345 [Flavobacterium sp. j3]|uniref:Tetratricopeptide repeat protein n=1 Tax=Flavobacterium aureirubrum TaxID=3133147 RepID=A0ABU9N916_9FLAO